MSKLTKEEKEIIAKICRAVVTQNIENQSIDELTKHLKEHNLDITRPRVAIEIMKNMKALQKEAEKQQGD